MKFWTPFLVVVNWGILGGLLSSVAWIAYYLFWNPSPGYVTIFSISTVVAAILFVAYLRFIKFMERR